MSEQIIYSKLSGDITITNVVGSGVNCRVYPNQALAGCSLPYIVFKKTGVPGVNGTQSGQSPTDTDQYTVHTTADTLTAALALAELVRSSLDFAAGTIASITGVMVRFEDQASDYVDGVTTRGASTVVQSYSVRYNR